MRGDHDTELSVLDWIHVQTRTRLGVASGTYRIECPWCFPVDDGDQRGFLARPDLLLPGRSLPNAKGSRHNAQILPDDIPHGAFPARDRLPVLSVPE